MRRVVTFLVLTLAAAVAVHGQLAERPLIDAAIHPAIRYADRPTRDAVGELVDRIAAGTARLTFEEPTGYLRSVLDALQIPIASQMLVMSKTGVQGLYTGPENPRAIYFNDTVSVGYIRGAPLLEIAVLDPEQGEVFYTIDQKPQPEPLIDKRRGCGTCHLGFATLHVPGLLLRSVTIAPDGSSGAQLGAAVTPDHRTPFRQRFGGWYVTGTHGAMRHAGNVVLPRGEKLDAAVSDRTLNRTSLDGAFDARGYLSPHSDLVALLVFQHQVQMTNLITRIGWESRLAAHERRLDPSSGALRAGIDELVDYLLFVDEEPLAAAVQGTTGFATQFAAQGPRDRRGRSLRELDLEHRLLRYPCSYMIDSDAFRALHPDVRRAIYARMWEVLAGRETGPRSARLSEADRRNVMEILRDTLPDLPDALRTNDPAR